MLPMILQNFSLLHAVDKFFRYFCILFCNTIFHDSCIHYLFFLFYMGVFKIIYWCRRVEKSDMMQVFPNNRCTDKKDQISPYKGQKIIDYASKSFINKFHEVFKSGLLLLSLGIHLFSGRRKINRKTRDIESRPTSERFDSRVFRRFLSGSLNQNFRG